MGYKHINLVYVKIIVNNQYIERIMMGLEEYLRGEGERYYTRFAHFFVTD